MPTTLHAAIVDNNGNCPCISGVVITVTAGGTPCSSYGGTTTTIGCLAGDVMVCVEYDCNTGVMSFGCGPTDGVCTFKTAVASVICTPLSITATFTAAPSCNCTAGAISITVVITV